MIHKAIAVRYSIVLVTIIVVPALGQTKSLAVRDEIRFFLPDHTRCANLHDFLHEQLSSDPSYRIAERGEMAINVMLNCRVPRGTQAVVYNVSLSLGAQPIWSRYLSNYAAADTVVEAASARIIRALDSAIQQVRESKEKLEAVDPSEYPQEWEDGGFSQAEHSLVLRALRELLD